MAAGLLSYALLHDWFAQDKPFSQLAIIGIAAFTSAELLSVAKVGVIRWLRARIAALAGVPQLEQKIEPNNEGGES